MELLQVIRRFRFNELDLDWVENQWRQDFSSDKDLPPEYAIGLEDENYADLLISLCRGLDDWTPCADGSHNESSLNASSAERRSWSNLLGDEEFNGELNHKALIAVVSSFLRSDVKEFTDDVSRSLALAASQAYFHMLSIRGAQIFNIYNSILFGQAVESLKILTLSQDSQDKPKSQGKGRKKKNKNDEENEEFPEDSEAIHISPNEKQFLIKRTLSVLRSFEGCLGILSLNGDEDVITCVITALIHVTRLEKLSSTFVQNTQKSTTVTYVSHLAYRVMLALCNARHGNVSDIVRYICRVLLSHLVMSAQEMHTNDKTRNTIRAHMVAFIKLMIDELGEPSYNGVFALVQQLCIRSPDKADIRGRCVLQIFSILTYFPAELFSRCSLWICSLAHAESVKHRVMGIEILTKLLNTENKTGENMDVVVSSKPDKPPSPPNSPSTNGQPQDEQNEEDSDSPEEEETSIVLPINHTLFLRALLSRMVDISPTVRAKCLSSFAPLILLKTPVIRELMHSIFIQPYEGLTSISSTSRDDGRSDVDIRSIFSRKNVSPGAVTLPIGTRVMKTILLLTRDQKVFVRKSAVNVLCNICRLNPQWVTPERVEVMVTSCLDFSVIVRKMMIQCLTELVIDYPTNDLLVKAWVKGVLPLVSDNEIKVQEKALESCTSVVLDNLVAHNQMHSDSHALPWKVIKLTTLYELRRVFKFSCNHWVKIKRVGVKEMKILQSYIGSEHDLVAWYFIVCVSEFTDFHNPDMVVEYYLENIYNKPIVKELNNQLVLEALLLNWRHVDSKILEDLVQNKLLPLLENCQLPLPSITSVMDLCYLYNQAEFSEVAKRIIEKCVAYIQKHVSPTSPPRVNEIVLSQYIFTLGDANAICPGHLPKETIEYLSSLVGGLSNEKDKKWPGQVGSTCKAVTVATLGKFCLQDHFLAKKLVPVLGTLLDPHTSSEVKLNTLTTMTDLCVRFTSIVETYLGDMCVCLKDSEVRVRKTTLDLMIGLIQEDYIKLKCPYFFYVLHMLHDPEPQIRMTTRAFMLNTILVKHPKIMVHEFIQALYFLNDYEVLDVLGQVHNPVQQNPNEKKVFLLSGDGNKEKRRELLRFMMEHMVDDHKLKTLFNICSEIFDSVSEDKIPVTPKSMPLISDTIYILGCDELRVNSSKSKAEEEDEMSPSGPETEMIAMAVNELVKRVIQDRVMPLIIKFKRKLQEVKSPLVRDLMISLQALMKDYKEWIQEVYSADPILSSEIELDMRMLEEKEEEEEEEQNRETSSGNQSESFPDIPKALNFSDKSPQPSVALTPFDTSLLNKNGRVNLTPRVSLSLSMSRVSLRDSTTPSPAPAAFSDDDGSTPSTVRSPTDRPQPNNKSLEGTSSSTASSPRTPILKPPNSKKRLSSHSPNSGSSTPSSSSSASLTSRRKLNPKDAKSTEAPNEKKRRNKLKKAKR